MKKNIFKISPVAAVAATAGYGVYENQKQNMISDVIMKKNCKSTKGMYDGTTCFPKLPDTLSLFYLFNEL